MNSDIVNFQLDKNSGSIIKVIGVGGGGGNAVNHMYQQGIKDVDFMVCNTDAQALDNSPVPFKIQLGTSLTEGRGAGNKPEIGKESAIESLDEIIKVLELNTKMVFITAGMGGGTGTGAAPIIAEACKKMGFLTVGIVTIPFRNEGRRRIRQAIEGITLLQSYVDSLLVINNERIREMYGDFAISEAFAKADNVLSIAARGIAEIITVAGYINVDFADVETVMRESGVALMGTSLAEGEGRAIRAAEDALNSPLLNHNDINGAKNILLNVTSGSAEITMDEIGQVTDYVQDKAGFEADLIWGNGIDESLGDKISVTIIATGFSMSSIPEVLINRKAEKETHSLEIKPETRKPEAKVPPEVEIKKDHNPKQQTFEFDVKAQKEPLSEFEVLYPKTSKERIQKNEQERQKIDYSELSEESIEELEKVPAYVRKQMKSPLRKKPVVSNYTLNSKSDQGQNFFRDKNSYLHDNVD